MKNDPIANLIKSRSLGDMYEIIDNLNEWDLVDLYKKYVGDARKLPLDTLRCELLPYVERTILTDLSVKN